MSADTDARYLFRRAREEAEKADAAVARRASEAASALTLYRNASSRCAAISASAPEQVLCDAMEKFNSSGHAGAGTIAH